MAKNTGFRVISLIAVMFSVVMLSACPGGVQCPPPSGQSTSAVSGGIHGLLSAQASSGSTVCSSNGGGGTGGTGACSKTVTPNNVIYTLDANGNVLEYAIDINTGALTLMCNTATTATGGVPVVSKNNFLYVFDASGGQIFAFSIQHGNTGALTPVTGQPFQIKLQSNETLGSSFMEADPLGRFLFVTNPDNSLVHVYSISSTSPGLGALTEVTNSPFAVSSPEHLAVDRTGNFVYVADPTDGEILIFTINAQGQLAPGTASSFFLLDTGADAPNFLLEHPTLPVLYSSNDNSIAAMTIDTGTGALSAVLGSPFSVFPSIPSFLAIDNTGSFIYANDINVNQNQSQEAILGDSLDSTTGGLTGVLPGSEFGFSPGNTEIFQVISNPAGGNIYAVEANATSGTSGFVINYPITASSGALTVPTTASTLIAESDMAIANVQ
jgi:6-phosphogluconolactonase